MHGDYWDLLLSNVAFQSYTYHMDPRVNLGYCQKRMNGIFKSVNLLFVSAPNKNNLFAVEKFSRFLFFFWCTKKKLINISTPSFMQLTLFQVASQIKFSFLILGALTILFPLKMQAHVSGKPDFYWERFEIISTHWQFLKTCQNGYFLFFLHCL